MVFCPSETLITDIILQANLGELWHPYFKENKLRDLSKAK